MAFLLPVLLFRCCSPVVRGDATAELWPLALRTRLLGAGREWFGGMGGPAGWHLERRGGQSGRTRCTAHGSERSRGEV